VTTITTCPICGSNDIIQDWYAQDFSPMGFRGCGPAFKTVRTYKADGCHCGNCGVKFAWNKEGEPLFK